MAFFSRMSNFFVRRRNPTPQPDNTLVGVSSPRFETGTPVETLGTSPVILGETSSSGVNQVASLRKSQKRHQPLLLAKVALSIAFLATLLSGTGASLAIWEMIAQQAFCGNPLVSMPALIVVESAPFLFNLAACFRILPHTPWRLCGLMQALKTHRRISPWLRSLPVIHLYLTVAVAVAVAVVAFLSCDILGFIFYCAATHSLLVAAILIHVHKCVVPSHDLSRDRPAAPQDVPTIPQGAWPNPPVQTVS